MIKIWNIGKEDFGLFGHKRSLILIKLKIFFNNKYQTFSKTEFNNFLIIK